MTPPAWGWRVYDYSGLGREGVRLVFLTTAARHGAIPWEYGGFCYFEELRGPEFGGVKLRWAERGSQIVVAQVPVFLPPVLPLGFDFDAREERVGRAAYPERRGARKSRKGQRSTRGE